MTRMTLAQAAEDFADTVEQARDEPVQVEREGEPVAVVLSFETYQRMAAPEDERLRSLTAFWDREIERRMAEPALFEATEEFWADIRRDDGEPLDPHSLALPPR